MDDLLWVLFLSRAIERPLIVVVALASLTMGWHLFRIGVADPQSAAAAAHGISVKLSRVAPGVFFALFGSLVIVVSMRTPLEFDLKRLVRLRSPLSQEAAVPQGAELAAGASEAAAPGLARSNVSVAYAANSSVSDGQRSLAAALNSSIALLRILKSYGDSAADSNEIAITQARLEGARDSIVREAFSAAEVVEYHRISAIPESQRSDAEREHYRLVYALAGRRSMEAK